MKLTKASLLVNYTISIVKRSSIHQSSALFCSSSRASDFGLTEEIPQIKPSFQTIQFFSKEIANLPKKQENKMNLSNDPRDFEVYYMHEGEWKPTVKKRRSSKRNERKNTRKA